MIHVIYISTPVIFFFIGLAIGTHNERKEWNKLIKKGIIPKPNKKLN